MKPAANFIFDVIDTITFILLTVQLAFVFLHYQTLAPSTPPKKPKLYRGQYSNLYYHNFYFKNPNNRDNRGGGEDVLF